MTCKYCGFEGTKAVDSFLAKQPLAGQMRLAIVGEMPGFVEEARGVPLVGPSGTLLRDVLTEIGVDMDSCLLGNVFCHKVADHNFTPKEIDFARQAILDDLADFKPDHILALGGVALQALSPAHSAISKRRAIWHSLELEGRHIDVMPTYNPAFLWKSPGLFK